ncbi:MAG: MFS transporter [Asgard group archaeon]|nr:MFS transporter [Asgard group archaeon]
MNQERFPYGRTALISFGFFTNNLTWSTYNVYVPLFLSNNFMDIFGEDANIINTLVGIVMIFDNIASVIIQPAIGDLSDKSWFKKFGRRMPFVIIGIPLAAFYFGLIGSFQNTLWVLLVAIVGFNICMAFYKSPAMSLVPDTLPTEYRSQGSGVLNVVGGFAGIIGLITVSTLLKHNSKFSFWALSLMLIVSMIILMLSVREKKEAEIEKSEGKVNLISTIRSTFKEGDRTLLLMLFVILFQTAGWTVFETFVSRYATGVLGLNEETSGYILAVFVGFSIIVALPAGLIGRRIGALNAVLVGLIVFLIALVPITIVSLTSTEILSDILTLNTLKPPYVDWTTPFYAALVVLLGFSWLVVSINSIVVIWNMAPSKKMATYTSYFYVFLHLASIISPFLAGGLFDLYGFIGKQRGNVDANGLDIMFVYVLACFIVAVSIALVVKFKRQRHLKKIYETDEYILKSLEQKEYPLMFLPMLLFGIGLREEKALAVLRREQAKERRALKRKIRRLIRERRKLKSDVIVGDIKDDELARLLEIKEYRELEKLLRKEHREKLRELRDDIFKARIKDKMGEESSKKDDNND